MVKTGWLTADTEGRDGVSEPMIDTEVLLCCQGISRVVVFRNQARSAATYRTFPIDWDFIGIQLDSFGRQIR
jgi:hypothetical protein